MKKKISVILLCGLLLCVCGCGKEETEKIITYRCGTIQDEEYGEFTYNETTNEYLTMKAYWQVFDIPEEELENDKIEYEKMATKFKKNVDLNVNWKFENNSLIETTEIELSKVDDEFMTYIEKVGEKYDFVESAEAIYFTLKEQIYSNGSIDNEKITSLINENNCIVVE